MKHDYLNLATGAPARLALLRKSATGTNWRQPMTWRECRFANFKDASSLDAGMNDNKPVWYGFGEQFTREQFADEVKDSSIKHTGWYCDGFQDEKARGIVVNLPHGRFLAGYHWDSNDERVYFPELHDSARDAALMADEHARVFAEDQAIHNARFSAAQQIESEIEQAQTRLCECFALRNKAKFRKMRATIAELISGIREKRETLVRDFSQYI